MQKRLFNIFFYLFFIFMINREFNPFGLDMRIIGVVLSIILIALELKNIIFQKKNIKLHKIDYFIILFFVICFFSNIMWIFNGLEIRFSEFFVILVSYVSNFLFYIVFRLYQQNITLDKFKKAMFLSVSILIFSMLLVFFGINIQVLFMSNCKGFVRDLAPNFLGGIYRYGGFAEDPNYASLFLIIGIATEFYTKYKTNERINYILVLLASFCFMLSASKTTLIALIPATFMLFVKHLKFKTIINYSWMTMIILIPVLFILSDIDFMDSIVTMSQRFRMWDFSLELFSKNPIFGNGLTSIRSYLKMSGWWYVQCHSTIFQMLSETGIISVILFGIILTKSLLKDNKYLTFIVSLFSIYMITTETAYHVYFIFILAILPIIVDKCEVKESKKKKASVFVVNSLSSGGAERVVSVMANNMKDDKVFIITLQDNVIYNIDSNIKIISLQSKKKLGKLEKYLKLPLLVFRFNIIYNRIKKHYNIQLSTTHLLNSHFLCRLSKYRKDFAFVIHNPYYPFDKKNSILFKKKIQFLYTNMKVICVSKGVENELKNRYSVKTKQITTIYNPIDFEAIHSKMNQKVKEENYILFCGRFNEAKRPVHAVEMFYTQKLYESYNLLMIGTGELEEVVRQKVKEYGLDNKVILKGWCDNPYAYMKNALLMFNCSHFEAFPMTLIEALACDCKVVSYDINYGPNELLVGDLKQCLVPFDNMKQMADTIIKTINNKKIDFSPYIKSYKITEIVDKYYKVYTNWVKQ